MANVCIIYGQSGSGKSSSLRNFDPEEISIVNVLGKRLPFKGKFKTANTDNYQQIFAYINKTPKKVIVIDDSTYLMTNEYMRNANVTGYQKFTNMAFNYNSLIDQCIALPDDVNVYIMCHVEKDADGFEKIRTIGKMLDEKVCIEGKVTIVLKALVKDGQHFFSTQSNGNDLCKTPIGMFSEPMIDNDLKAVDTAIREYYS